MYACTHLCMHSSNICQLNPVLTLHSCVCMHICDRIWEKLPLMYMDKYLEIHNSMNYISRMHGVTYMQFSTIVQVLKVFQFMNSSMSS